MFALRSKITQASVSLVCKPWLTNGIVSARRIFSTEVLEWEKTPKQNTFRRIHHSSRTSRQNLCIEIIKVYMTDFFTCSIKSPQCTDMYRKEKFSIAIFLPRFLMYKKRQVSLSVGYKTARSKRGHLEWLWRNLRTSCFAKNRFLSHFLIVRWSIR